MGWIRDTKAAVALNEARRAMEQNKTTLVYNFNVPVTMATLSGLVPDAAEVIESIESAGWMLVDFTYAPQHAKNGSLVLLFRRPRH